LVSWAGGWQLTGNVISAKCSRPPADNATLDAHGTRDTKHHNHRDHCPNDLGLRGADPLKYLPASLIFLEDFFLHDHFQVLGNLQVLDQGYGVHRAGAIEFRAATAKPGDRGARTETTVRHAADGLQAM
jgi:hypothetical protein